MSLTQTQASHFVSLPLAGLKREYPNYIMHLLNGSQDVASPSALHPVFYGCYDWHSAVHGFWLLARCGRLYPQLPELPEILALFDSHFTASAFEQETTYFEQAGRANFERPYGWGWFFALVQELESWSHPQAANWVAHMQPLRQLLRDRTIDYLRRLSYPIRVGTHYNTAFAMVLSYDYAKQAQDSGLQQAIEQAARRYFLADRDYPLHYEPNGDDFLSGGLCEALLMSRVLSATEFTTWLEGFAPQLAQLTTLLPTAEVSDREDPKIAHLDGLNLSRAWCLRQLAAVVPPSHPAHSQLENHAKAHLDSSLPHIASGHYAGEHWLATFAMLASQQT